jgi:hypothetical protein
MPVLDREQKTYESELVHMLQGQGEGQFVVIQGDRVCKFEPTYEQALSWGYAAFGLDPFLVKQVTAVEPEVYFSRFAGLCAG